MFARVHRLETAASHSLGDKMHRISVTNVN